MYQINFHFCICNMSDRGRNNQKVERLKNVVQVQKLGANSIFGSLNKVITIELRIPNHISGFLSKFGNLNLSNGSVFVHIKNTFEM